MASDSSLESAGAIRFGSTLDGASNLTLSANGNVSFVGKVGSKGPLAAITFSRAASVTAYDTVMLDGSARGAGANGIRFAAGVNNVSMTKPGSSIRNFAAAGIRFDGGSKNSTISGFTVDRNGVDGIQCDLGFYGGTNLISNTVTNNPQVGIRASGTVGLSISKNLVTGNGTGIAVSNSGGSVDGTSVKGNTVSKNGDGVVLGPTAQGVTIGGLGGQDGNTIQSNARYGIELEPGDYSSTSIQGNRIVANGGPGIRGNIGGARNLLVGSPRVGGPGGNIITNNGCDGIEFDLGEYRGTRIYGNTVADNVHVGIRASGTTNLTISGNKVSGSGTGFALADSGSTMKGTVVTANLVSGNQDGISLWTGATGMTVGGTTPGSGNIVTNNSRDGFSIDSGECTGTVIQGNTVSANGRDGVRFNEGPGTTSLIFGSLARGGGNTISRNAGNGIYLAAGDYREIGRAHV